MCRSFRIRRGSVGSDSRGGRGVNRRARWDSCLALRVWILILCRALGEFPAYSQEAFSIIHVAAEKDGMVLNWLQSPGAYTVETRSAFGQDDWEPAPGNVWPIATPSWKDALPVASGARFYRISAFEPGADRGALLAAIPIAAYSASQIGDLFAQAGVPLAPGGAVHAYRLDYETVNPFGLRTLASGLMVLPDGATNALPLASYQHGTIVRKEEAPSRMNSTESIIGVAMATSGYVGVLPDYLGLGDSPGLHPFLHAQSEATTVIDLLRATRTFCAAQSVALNGQLFLLGYSEGGHATMAAHREIEAHYTNEFHVTASAPMAGPYDLSGTTANDFLSGRAMPNPYYFLYLLGAYQSIYHVASSFSSVLASTYVTSLPPLLDGKHESSAINKAIGTPFPTHVANAEFLEQFRNDPNHPLRAALRLNDVYDWAPRAPMHLYHCAADEDVLFANSQVAFDRFQSLGVSSVELLGGDVELGHTECAPISILAAKLWFDSLRTGTP